MLAQRIRSGPVAAQTDRRSSSVSSAMEFKSEMHVYSSSCVMEFPSTHLRLQKDHYALREHRTGRPTLWTAREETELDKSEQGIFTVSYMSGAFAVTRRGIPKAGPLELVTLAA